MATVLIEQGGGPDGRHLMESQEYEGGSNG